jgi:hypothetical protein
MLCDPRVISKPYGKRIWQSLPSFKRTREQADVIAFFQNPPPAGRGIRHSPRASFLPFSCLDSPAHFALAQRAGSGR